jgi:GntR family transcriptional regulator
LQDRIEAGAWPVGARLPTEIEICREFGASRHTVREALRRLVALGMVARRQGSGSVVTAQRPGAAYVQSFASLSELFQFALDTHFGVRSIRKAVPSAAIQAVIGGRPGESWLLVKGLRSVSPGGAPICWTHSYVPWRLAGFGPELRDCRGPFYAHLETRSGERILQAEQEISAETMNSEIAQALDCRPGSVTLCVLRRYLTENGTLIASLNWHRAEDFRYRMRLHLAE